MDVDYIIVQAGGRGTRLGYLTANRPKALIPVENIPMIFHLFRKFPNKRFIIIADYKKEVLREYLECFADVKYQVIDAIGNGTCAGIKQAIELIPDKNPFMLIWSDLILSDNFMLPLNSANYIGISQTFLCRWSFFDCKFEEMPSEEHGVAGLFIFMDKSFLNNVPNSGEFVRWIKERNIQFLELALAGTKEFGLLVEYEKLEKDKCRPFNKITIDGNVLVKEGIDEQGEELAQLEKRWYEFVTNKNVNMIPKIYSANPICMEVVNGKNIYEYTNLSYEEKKVVLQKLVNALKSLHGLENMSADPFCMREAYYQKTMDRLHKIRDLVPFANRRIIIVNGRKCRNVFFYKRELEKKLESITCEIFTVIHGDCTFSNLLLRNNAEPILIDPRGYFGFMEIYGDPVYDWAKLYYSLVGNYDRFNLKDFRLSISENEVELKIESNHWEELERDFFEMSDTDPDAIKLIHAIIWLSLTTYAWQDYDSICGAFYNGLYYLEEVL